jgi:hypothetical protein
MVAILTGVRWNLSLVLICISFMARDGESFWNYLGAWPAFPWNPHFVHNKLFHVLGAYVLFFCSIWVEITGRPGATPLVLLVLSSRGSQAGLPNPEAYGFKLSKLDPYCPRWSEAYYFRLQSVNTKWVELQLLSFRCWILSSLNHSDFLKHFQ